MPKEFDPAHAAANGYTRADWDAVDSPELTGDEIRSAIPFREGFPELAAKMKEELTRRGRPPLENPKVSTTIRLDADLLERLRAGGKGWQTRANALLREAMGL